MTSPLSLSSSLAVALTSLGFFLAGAPARCEEQEGPLKTALISQINQVRPGEAFYAGLHLDPKDGYHVYWKFPGIVGVPVSMEWTLPPGWKAGEMEWPEPHQVHMFQIRAQGYHGPMVIPVKLYPPKNLVPGTPVTLMVKAAWMCCGRDCNPGFADLKLTLPVSDSAPEPNQKWVADFAKAKAAQPVPMQGWTTSTSTAGKVVTLRIKPESEVARRHGATVKEVLFFTDDGYINADKDQPLRREADGTIVMELEVSEYYSDPLPKKLVGLLQSPQKWDPAATAKTVSISVPLK